MSKLDMAFYLLKNFTKLCFYQFQKFIIDSKTTRSNMLLNRIVPKETISINFTTQIFAYEKI